MACPLEVSNVDDELDEQGTNNKKVSGFGVALPCFGMFAACLCTMFARFCVSDARCNDGKRINLVIKNTHRRKKRDSC